MHAVRRDAVDEKTSDIRVTDASSPEVARCIADAMAKITVDLNVTCIATLSLGGSPDAGTNG